MVEMQEFLWQVTSVRNHFIQREFQLINDQYDRLLGGQVSKSHLNSNPYEHHRNEEILEETKWDPTATVM